MMPGLRVVATAIDAQAGVIVIMGVVNDTGGGW